MAGDVVVRLVPEPGADGFWPRENHFGGGADNGYAITLRPADAVVLAPGTLLRLRVDHHVSHLPYRYQGERVTLGPEREVTLLFPWSGAVRVLGADEIEMGVRHAFDPVGTTETVDAEGNSVVQQGRRGTAILYRGEVVPS